MTDIALHKPAEPEPDNVTRGLPHAVGPEKSVLSSILQDPQDFMDIALEEQLSPAHFYLPNHTELFGFLTKLHEQGKEIELVSLVQRLLDAGLLEKCGGPGYISGIYTYAPSTGHFHQHLKHLKDKFILRSILRASGEAVRAVYEEPEDPAALLDETERMILAIREGNEEKETHTAKDDLREIMEEFERKVRGEDNPADGIKTGFEELDRMTGGLQPGELYVLAARPSMGKTSLMMNIVEEIAINQAKPTLVFSAEMSRKQLLKRLTFARSKFFVGSLDRGHKMTKQEGERIRGASQAIANAPLLIDDRSSPNINQIRARARREKKRKGLELLAVDYLQLCASTSKQANGSREREIAEISAGLKGIGKELGIPVIVLAQINRDVEKRTGKAKGKPRMSDLRESGAVEQDADLVGLLTRPKYYADNDEERAALEGKAELIIAKNRNGATGSIPLTFIEELMRFETGAPWEEELDAPETDRFGNPL